MSQEQQLQLQQQQKPHYTAAQLQYMRDKATRKAADEVQTMNDVRKQAEAVKLARMRQAKWGGSTWSTEQPCDASVSEGVKFAAALVLRNLARSSNNRPLFKPYEADILMHVAAGSATSNVLAGCLAALSE